MLCVRAERRRAYRHPDLRRFPEERARDAAVRVLLHFRQRPPRLNHHAVRHRRRRARRQHLHHRWVSITTTLFLLEQ